MDEKLARRIMAALLGQPLVNNVFRGTLVEAILAEALDPDWSWCSGEDAWAGFDFVNSTGVGLEVKQSAALQAWFNPGRRPSSGVFDIAPRKQQWDYEKLSWIAIAGRPAAVYIFARHPVEDVAIADHRDAAQWQFYPVRSDHLPNQKTISLNRVRRLSEPYDFNHIKLAVRRLVLSPT